MAFETINGVPTEVTRAEFEASTRKFSLPVLDMNLVDAPVAPNVGDRHIVAAGALGDWAGEDNSIAEWDGLSWIFTAPSVGTICWVTSESEFFAYNGATWNKESFHDHASTHVGGGTDAMAVATTSVAGLMANADKTKLDESVDLYGDFIVGNHPAARYTTVQAAVTAAELTGTPQVVAVTHGDYDELVTIAASADLKLVGIVPWGETIDFANDEPQTKIRAICVTGAGSLVVQDALIESAVGSPIEISGAGHKSITFKRSKVRAVGDVGDLITFTGGADALDLYIRDNSLFWLDTAAVTTRRVLIDGAVECYVSVKDSRIIHQRALSAQAEAFKFENAWSWLELEDSRCQGQVVIDGADGMSADRSFVACAGGVSAIILDSDLTGTGSYFNGHVFPSVGGAFANTLANNDLDTFERAFAAIVGPGQRYTTVQAAIDAAPEGTSSVPIRIGIMPGTYAENLSLKIYHEIVCTVEHTRAKINGTHTLDYDSVAGTSFWTKFTGIDNSVAASTLVFAGTSNKQITLTNCNFGSTDGDAVQFGGTGNVHLRLVNTTLQLSNAANELWNVTGTPANITVTTAEQSRLYHAGRAFAAGPLVTISNTMVLQMFDSETLGEIIISAADVIFASKNVHFRNPLMGAAGTHITINNALHSDSYLIPRYLGEVINITGAHAASLKEPAVDGVQLGSTLVWRGSRWVAMRYNYAATVDPTPTDDLSLGYFMGSIWNNIVTHKVFIMTLQVGTGNAVWTPLN